MNNGPGEINEIERMHFHYSIPDRTIHFIRQMAWIFFLKASLKWVNNLLAFSLRLIFDFKFLAAQSNLELKRVMRNGLKCRDHS